MEQEIQLFSNKQFGEVHTVVNEQDEVLFCLVDVCKALDLRPGDVRPRLSDGVVSTHPISDALGRTQQANFVNEDGLYDVILDSRKPEAKTFRKWITSEVLPSIRKHGIYATQEVIDNIIANPDYGIQLLSALKKERETKEVAKHRFHITA